MGKKPTTKKPTTEVIKVKETATEVIVPQQQVEVQTDNSVEGFISQAIAEKLPVETIERFLAMRKELKADQAKEAFTMAMANFQKDCPVIAKTKEVKNKQGVVTYRYASIDSIIIQIKGVLGDNQLAYDFSENRDEKTVTVICTITHSLGHSKSSSFTVEIGTEAYMTDTQKYGARNTFAKRYALMNILGIATGDEDTDAKEITPKDTKKPADPKAQIIVMLRKLGVTDTTNAEDTKENILKFTQLEPTPENITEILDRLSTLVDENNENS